jgi:hypothetical protein
MLLIVILIGILVITMVTFAVLYIVLYNKHQKQFDERDVKLMEHGETIQQNKMKQDAQYMKNKRLQSNLHKNVHQLYDQNVRDVQNLGTIVSNELIDIKEQTSNHSDSILKLDRVSKKRDQVFKQKYASINDTIVNADNIKRGLDLSIHQINTNIEKINYKHDIVVTNMKSLRSQLDSNKATMKQVNDAVVELNSTVVYVYKALVAQRDRLVELEGVMFSLASKDQVDPAQVEAMDMKLEETRRANLALQTQLKNIESSITTTLSGTQITDLSTKLVDLSKKVTDISTELEKTAKQLCIGDTCITQDTLQKLMAPRNCEVLSWNPCDKPCGSGTQTPSKTIPEVNGGVPCPTNQTCNTQPCPPSLPGNISVVPGWSREYPPVNPPDWEYNQTPEMCRQKALNSGGKYVAWGHRNETHPNPGMKNTCFLYTAPMGPYKGNIDDKVHITGCLRPGEKVEWGCKTVDPQTVIVAAKQVVSPTPLAYTYTYTTAPFIPGNTDSKNLVWYTNSNGSYWTGLGKPFWLCDSPPYNQSHKRIYEKIYYSSSFDDVYCKFHFNTDNTGILYLNNIQIGKSDKWETTTTVYGYLKYGHNRIQLEVTNLGGPGGGILSCSRNNDGAVLFVTDSSWKMSDAQIPGDISMVSGWASEYPREDPPENTNQTPEMCRQKALNSGGKYVAWGHRNETHPNSGYRNTCFLYPAPMGPYKGDITDKAHTTGCLRPGEKVEWGCKTTAPVSSTDVRESDGKVWAYKGCWNDFAYKGLPRPLVDNIGRFSGTDAEIRQRCAKHARSSGANIFAIQDGNACMIGNTSKHNYARDGISSGCTGMKGGPWLNSVWVLE